MYQRGQYNVAEQQANNCLHTFESHTNATRIITSSARTNAEGYTSRSTSDCLFLLYNIYHV